MYDDNIYFTHEDRQHGTAIRFRPGLFGTHRLTRTLSLAGAFSSDVDFFPEHPELNSTFSAKAASLQAQYRLGSATTLVAGGHYTASWNAADLVPYAGLEYGRLFGKSWGLQAGASRRVGGGGSVDLSYSFGSVSYRTEAAPVRAHALSLSWTQPLSERVSVGLGAGPRYGDDGSLSADGSASLRYRLERGMLSLGYSRGRFAAPGREVDTSGVSASAELRLSRAITVTASPGLFWQDAGAATGRSWRMVAGVGYELSPALTAQLSYQHASQNDLALAPSGPRRPWLSRNTFGLNLTASAARPRRKESPAGLGPGRPGPTPVMDGGANR
jgi:hypothetical protein